MIKVELSLSEQAKYEIIKSLVDNDGIKISLTTLTNILYDEFILSPRSI